MAKTGLIIGVVVGLLVLGGGGFVGAAYMGVVKVPGITPKNKLIAANKLYGEKGAGAAKPGAKPEPKKVAKLTPPPKPKPVAPKPTHTIEPEMGAQRVADVWSGMESDALVAIVADWRDNDLARVLALMDDQKTGELLAKLEPKRASRLTKALQAESSRVPVEPDR